MNQINFHHLYHFYIVAKEGSIKVASQKLHITQPTLSTQIKSLEEQLSLNLFERKHRKLELTEAGLSLLKKSEKIFNLADQLVSSIGSSQSDRDHIKIGIPLSVSHNFITDFSLKIWRDDTIKTSIQHNHVQNLIQMLDNDQIDLLITDSPLHISGRHESFYLGEDKLVAVAHSKFNLPNKKFPQNLNRQKYIRFTQDIPLQSDINYFLKNNSIRPEVIGEVDDTALLRYLSNNKLAFSILPYRSVKKQIKPEGLKLLGELKGVKLTLWAVCSKSSKKQLTLHKVINDFFLRSKK
ncbi:MAG: LysR family transcriptional regulator [Bdellovibrionales bacterium]|nr:LysR family transcriptional regulator [Bdellovibrionales bacterium]